jgi:acetylornithine deacetylase/succinyl-diaminopimelate desuccinylase-like protein
MGNLRGMKAIANRFAGQPAVYIVLEGMALGHIYHRGLPARRYEVMTTTEGGHAWIHAGRPSAIHTLIAIGAELTKLVPPSEPRSTLNIGRIDGGTSINTIANRASMKIDLRSEDIEALGHLEAWAKEVVHAPQNNDVKVEMKLIGERPGGGLSKNHPLVQTAIKALKECGEKDIHLRLGSTDASVPLSLGRPAICVGVTRGGNAHSLNEYIEIEPINRGYDALVLTIETILKDPARFTV